METKQKRAKVMVSLLALAGLAVFSLFAVGGSLEPSAPPGPTMKTLDEVEPRIPISQADIPLTISTPGSYYLTEDVTAAGTAITVAVDNVTIDLMGYQLIGPGSGYNSGIYMYGRSNVEIRNGTVRNFGQYGICEDYGTDGKEHRLIAVRVISNVDNGIYLKGKNHLAKDCSAEGNGADGIHVEVVGATVTGNTASNNQGNGIYAGSGSTVTVNTAYNNQGHGIRTFSGSTVIGNTVHSNQQYGIYANWGCTVTSNTAYGNQQHGIFAGAGSTVTANAARDNQWHGIYLGGQCLVDQNTAFFNNLSGGSYANISPCVTCTFGLNHAP